MTDKQRHTFYYSDEKCEVTGVIGVVEYDDKEIVLKLSQSILTISGESLELENLSVDNQTACVVGKLTAIKYKKSAPKLSLIKRLAK